MKKALIIEDDELIRSNILELLEEEGFEALGAENGRVGLELARSEVPDLIVCDIRMPELSGLEVLSALRQSSETRAVPFIFLSAAAERTDIRKGMNLGADDYVTKPFTRAELLDAIRSRLERQETVASAAPIPSAAPPPGKKLEPKSDAVVIVDPKMEALYADAAKAAAAPISVLILGETGVGKEVLASWIHKSSPRRAAPFMALNCAALSETLLESELFGNERGAFTGAVAARPGLFEAAQGGTVFLDELGDLPMVIQVKLLRVLEERRVIRVGGRSPISIDVRFLAATNKDLEAKIADGTFREDLFYRLAGITLTIPPLRDRTSEIVPLAQRFARATGVNIGKGAPVISAEAQVAIARYSWPGNVRELRNVMDRAVVLAAGDVIQLTHLPGKIVNFAGGRDSLPLIDTSDARPPSVPPADFEGVGPVSSTRSLRGEMDELERKRIVEALEKSGGNQTVAAEILGISRRTLVSRLSTYDLPRPRKRP